MHSRETTTETKTCGEFSEMTVAYLKPVEKGFAVCNASGEQLAVFGTREAAFFNAIQHELTPVWLH